MPEGDIKKEMNFVMPPDFVFKRTTVATKNPGASVVYPTIIYELEKVVYPDTGGMYAWFKDCPYPAKGFPFPQALYAINFSKRILVNALKIPYNLGKWPLTVFGGAFLLLPKKQEISLITSVLDFYSETAYHVVHPFAIEENKWSPLSGELKRFIERFLTNIGVNYISASNFAEMVGLTVQYDNAYYFRLEDLLSTVTQREFSEDPIGTLDKIVSILIQRETFNTEIPLKFKRVVKLMKMLLWIPSIKEAFIESVDKSDFQNFQYEPLDEKGMSADIYHTLLWNDYQFRGLPIEERQQQYINFHTKYPPFPPRQQI